ncbi:MAG TPA: cell wall-binding repeat-containing protein [Nitriliruptorales bacterium]
MSRRSWVAATLVALLALGATAATVLARSAAPPSIVVLARADNPVDALAASTVAAQLGGVVLLTFPAELGAAARDGILAADPDLVILAGGEAALMPKVQTDVEALGYDTRRVAGEGRTETAAALAALLDEYDAGFVRVRDPGGRAQALVWGGADPGFDPARTYGFTAVTSPVPGVYCLTLDASREIDLATAVVLTTIDWGDSVGDDLVAHWVGTGESVCATGQVEVQTYRLDGGSAPTVDASFVVVVP